MPTVSEYRVSGLVFYNGEAFPVDNNFLLYSKPSRADILAEMASINVYPYSPEGEITADTMLIRRFSSKVYMTAKQFRQWFIDLTREQKKQGYNAYFYAMALNPSKCYAFIDFSICVPVSQGFDDLNAIVVGSGFRLVSQGRNRIDFGASGECEPSENWQSELIEAIASNTYWQRGGYQTRRCEE